MREVSANQRQVGGEHYGKESIQHWDLIERYGIGYLEGCATKYISRWKKKNGLEDLKKSDHYIQKLIELYDEGVRIPRGMVPHEVVDEFCKANDLGSVEMGAIFKLTNWRNRDMLLLAQRDVADLIMQASPRT